MLPRRHDHPGRGTGFNCRHTNGLDIVWSARHGVTTPLHRIPEAHEVDRSARTNAQPAEGAEIDAQFFGLVASQFDRRRSTPAEKAATSRKTSGNKGKETRPRQRVTGGGPRPRRAAIDWGLVLRASLLYGFLALGTGMLVGAVLGIAHVIALPLGPVALGLGLVAVVCASWIVISRVPVRRALSGAFDTRTTRRDTCCGPASYAALKA